jgi:signal transduction histidine kinase
LGIEPLSNLSSKTPPKSQHYSLIVRFFFLIASSLIFIGLAFDTFLLKQIDDSSDQNYLQLMQGPFNTLEKSLTAATQDQWPSIVDAASELSGYSVEIASRDDLIEMPNTDLEEEPKSKPKIQLLFTTSGDRLFYKPIANTGKVIFIGSIIFEEASAEQYRFLPLFFFISIFAVVWVWMRPMIKDLDILNQTVEKLAVDTTLNIDPYLMGLALSNLIYNAICYGKSTIRIGVTNQNGNIALSVEDDGKGIPEDQQKNIFKVFYRMEKSRDKKNGGFGLGLSIVKRIIELHGGTVMVKKSELGGVKFTLQWQ